MTYKHLFFNLLADDGLIQPKLKVFFFFDFSQCLVPGD